MRPYTFPSFVGGMGSALEIYPVPHTYVIRSPFAKLTDAQRLASDWYRVGRALYYALDVAKSERRVEEQSREK